MGNGRSELFRFFPVRVIATFLVFFLIRGFTGNRTKGAIDRKLITYCHPALFALAYFKRLMGFIETSLRSTHNEIIADATKKVKSVNIYLWR